MFSKKCAAVVLIIIIFILLQSCSMDKEHKGIPFFKGEETSAPWGARELMIRRDRCMDIPGNRLEDCR